MTSTGGTARPFLSEELPHRLCMLCYTLNRMHFRTTQFPELHWPVMVWPVMVSGHVAGLVAVEVRATQPAPGFAELHA
jgi:hypothetical protein